MDTYKFFFRRNGKPRSLIRLILFKPNRTPRKPFRRVVIKKNGTVRPSFQAWVSRTTGKKKTGASGGAADIEQPIPQLVMLEKLVPLEDKVKSWIHGKPRPELLDQQALLQKLSASPANWQIFSISHDDYTTIPGGVQVCIQREEKQTLARNGRYLNLHPWQPLPRLAHLEDDPDPLMVLVLNGAHIGVAPMSVVIAAATAQAAQGVASYVTVHHMLGHNPEQITELVRSAAAKDTAIWLHDYFTLCPGVRLQRNDLDYCGAPDPVSNACGLCIYGMERPAHLARMQTFFAATRPKVLSPSQVTLDIWSGRATYPTGGVHAVPHVTLEMVPRGTSSPQSTSSRIKLGFLGSPSHHKGWSVFNQLSYHPEMGERYDFVALTAAKVKLRGRQVPVHVTADAPDAAARAVREQEIDLVLHWPNWPETFALTAYEALEGGAYLVTNGGSGNVAATVHQTGRGVVLDDQDALVEFLLSDAATELASRARAERASHRATAHLSDLSLSVFEGAQ